MITGSDMPPEIREIVDEAGPQHCFYYSDSWRQATKPSDGVAAGEMPNTVPGFPIEATQGAASAQPISHNRGFSFEGDDWLDLPELVGRDFPTQYTIAGLWDLPSIDIGAYMAALYGPSTGGDSRIELRYDDRSSSADRIAADLRQGATTISADIEITEPVNAVAIAATYDVPSDTVTIALRDGDTGSDSNAGSLTSQNEQVDTANIGARLNGSNTITGACLEKLLARCVAPMDLTTLADRIWWRHQ